EPAFTQAFRLATSKRVRPEVQTLVIGISKSTSRAFHNTMVGVSRDKVPFLPGPIACDMDIEEVQDNTKQRRPLRKEETNKIQCGLSMIFKQLQNLKRVVISTLVHPTLFPSDHVPRFEPRTQELLCWLLENMAYPQQPPLETFEIRTGKRAQLNLNESAPHGSLMAQAGGTKTIRSAFEGLKSLTISTHIGMPNADTFCWLSHGLSAAAPTLKHLHLDFTFDMGSEDLGCTSDMCEHHYSERKVVNHYLEREVVNPSRLWELLGLNRLLFPRLRNVTLKNVAHHIDYASNLNRFLRRHNQVETLQQMILASWSCKTGLKDFPTAKTVSKMASGVDNSSGILNKVIIQRDFNTHEEKCKNAWHPGLITMTYWQLCLGELERKYQQGHSAETLYSELAYQVPLTFTMSVEDLFQGKPDRGLLDHIRDKGSKEKSLGY
ncbi:MAG: hypothetical protein Q9160_009309, partial [Pyrenula sp. 1 TL-2023]